MNQRSFLIKFSDAFANKTMRRMLIFRIFSFVMNWIIVSLSDPAPIILKHLRKNVNFLSKQISICNSIFSLMVREIDFELGMSSISLACFVKAVLYFSRYSCIIWIACFFSFKLKNKPLFALIFIFVKICRRGESTFQSCIFIISLTVKQRVMVLFSL